MFHTYNEKSCQFECRLKYAVKRSKCLPWDYPAPGNKTYPICRSSVRLNSSMPNQLTVFENAMNSAESLKDCLCPPNCQEISFESQVVVLPLDVNDLCDRHRNWGMIEMAMRDWEHTHSPLAYWHMATNEYHIDPRDFFKAEDINPMKINMSFGLPTDEAVRVCKERYHYDLAKLTVVITEPKVMLIKKDIKTTFTDQLGVIGKLKFVAVARLLKMIYLTGGTIGLFTGVSLISMMEALFWMLRVITDRQYKRE